MTTHETHPLSESDFLELISLQMKAKWEGSLHYTVENWPWLFDDPELSSAAANASPAVLRNALRIHAEQIREWWREHAEDGVDLINAHRERQGTWAASGQRPEEG